MIYEREQLYTSILSITFREQRFIPGRNLGKILNCITLRNAAYGAQIYNRSNFAK